MRNTSLIIALALLYFVGCSKSTGTAPDRLPSDAMSSESSSTEVASNKHPTSDIGSTVEQDYAALKQALHDGDGPMAASLVTASTLAEYETCRKLALDSSDTDFAKLNQLAVVMVFQIRFLLAKSKLQEMTGREVFEWGVSGGMVKKDTLAAMELHKVQYDAATAYATVSQHGKVAADGLFTFRKEDGRWKLDMMEIARLGGNQLDKIRTQAGKSKVEMAVYLLERTYGQQIPPSILDGPLK